MNQSSLFELRPTRKLLLIIILTTFGALKADLINGPYSPESQELVKIIQDKSLPIPEKFKAQETNIAAVRDFLEKNKTDFFWRIYRDKNLTNLVNTNPIFLEAFIQLFKSQGVSNDELSSFMSWNGLTAADYFPYRIAEVASGLENINLVTQAISAVSLKAKKRLLGTAVINLSKGSSIYDKEEMKVLVNSMPKEIAYPIIIEDVRPQIMDYLDSMKFLINVGLPVNSITQDKLTLLDKINNALSENGRFDTPELKKSQQETKDYLISKGAKTYVELTPAERGEK